MPSGINWVAGGATAAILLPLLAIGADMPFWIACILSATAGGGVVALLTPRKLFEHLDSSGAARGKIEFARAMAQSLLCESPESGIACGKCPACGWFREGNHPDFRELLPESMSDDDIDTDAPVDPEAKEKKKSKEIKIEQIRDIAAFMTLTTHRAGFRVLLVHPAEAMNPAAANALLKGLEEPEPGPELTWRTEPAGDEGLESE